MGREEAGPGRGKIGGEVTVAGDEKERGGVEKDQWNHPFQEAEAKRGLLAGRIETAEQVEAGDSDDPGDGPPIGGIFAAVG